MVTVYAAYALFSVVLTVVLARLLGRHGAVLLADVFEGQEELGKAVNQLLVIGFYLVNFGYACRLLTGGDAHDAVTSIETLAQKMGALLLSLAAMHFINLLIFQRIRRRHQLVTMPPPVVHQGHVGAQPTHRQVDPGTYSPMIPRV